METASFTSMRAAEIARRVRSGELDPREVVASSLASIARNDGDVGAFVVVREEAAHAEAAALTERDDLASLPLAGVPIAIKDNVDIAGEPTRHGSLAVDARPAPDDHPVVARLRAAGAILVGKTQVPELCCWGSTETAFGSSHNPWSLDRVTGGSSGGSAAAVAAGMAPLALGNDGMGSIRIPAAVCGLFGIKPGLGVVPSVLGASSWFAMAENGPLATTVQDARLMLSVLAEDPSFAAPARPERSLRIAVSTRPPVVGTRVAPAWRAAVDTAATLLFRAGHTVRTADPPYRPLDALALGARWGSGIAEDAEDLDHSRLQRRIRGHARFGRVLARAGFADDRWQASWVTRLDQFFADHDVLVTPTLAQPPPKAGNWHERSWFANVWRDTSYAPFAARFNLSATPAASVPMGVDGDGLPVAVQLVAPRGGEALLLAVAEQLESMHPWQRVAPAYDR